MIKEFLSRYFLIPVGMSLYGINYLKTFDYMNLLIKSEYTDFQKLTEFRNNRFQHLIQHCYSHVPYYRRYMELHGLQIKDFQTTADICKLPVLDKKQLNSQRELLIACNFNRSHLRIDRTGGSTGTPIQFITDRKSYYQVYANAWRFWGYAGYRPGMKMMLFWGNRSELMSAKNLKRRIKSYIENIIILNTYDLSKSLIYEYARQISKQRPAIIRGYAGTIYMFTEMCKKYEIEIGFYPTSIILTSENILTSQKKKIADFFKSEVFNEYGCREFGILAHECNYHDGLHLAEEQFIFEIYNSQLDRYQMEGNGEIIVSSLFNYAMPLLRYRLEDEVTITTKKCVCGRTSGVLTQIDGRIIDYILTKSEKLVHQSIFEDLFDILDGVITFQIRQNQKGAIQVLLVVDERFKMNELDNLLNEFYSLFKDDLIFTVEYVEEIELLPSGKRQLVLSNIDHEYLASSGMKRLKNENIKPK